MSDRRVPLARPWLGEKEIDALPASEQAGDQSIAMPLYPELGSDDVDRICSQFTDIL